MIGNIGIKRKNCVDLKAAPIRFLSLECNPARVFRDWHVGLHTVEHLNMACRALLLSANGQPFN
jgi:hypothetical protein